MAATNEELVTLLKEGKIEEFNRVRPEGEIDLQGAHLQGARLRGADLRGADLRGANLRGANLQRADLRWTKLQGADLRGANLYGVIGLSEDLKALIIINLKNSWS